LVPSAATVARHEYSFFALSLQVKLPFSHASRCQLMSTNQPRLAVREKLAYGIGDSGANFVFQTQISFLMFFYTDVFGIAAHIAANFLLVSRVVDAFTDPIIGALADRTRTRWGRYRPWILCTAAPLAIALVLCYTTPPLGASGKIVWAVVTYNLLMIIYAANNVPYSALAGVMTSDTHERTSLESWRFGCAMATALIVNLLTVDLVKVFGAGNPASGFQLTMVLWGAVATVFLLTTFAFTRERISPVSSQRTSVRQDLTDLFRNVPWITLFIVGVLIHIQLAIRGGTMLYYFRYYLQLERLVPWIDNFGVFSGIGLISTIVGVTLSKPLSTRFGKQTTFRVCLLVSAALMAAFVLLPPDAPISLFALQIALQLTFGPTIPILWAMMADVADYSEWKTGRRSTALAFASIIFGLKLGLGIGVWINGSLLEYIGYSPNHDLASTAKYGIVLMCSIIPAVALLVGSVVMMWYQLDDRFMKQIEVTLVARRKRLT
jgi:GPH family glycoside/pentoside/hexuronide:cation symporter